VKALLIVCALAGSARADDEPDDPPTHDRLLGMRIAGGLMPYDGRELLHMSLGVVAEYRVYQLLRVTAEYEYLLLDEYEDSTKVSDGTGHRASVVVRHALARSRLLDGKVRFWLDGEIGGGFLLASEAMAGRIAEPQAIAGIRLGYDFVKFHADTRASKVWEPDFQFRIYATPHQELGFSFGVETSWGD
jgi:hypothetical protein